MIDTVRERKLMDLPSWVLQYEQKLLKYFFIESGLFIISSLGNSRIVKRLSILHASATSKCSQTSAIRLSSTHMLFLVGSLEPLMKTLVLT